MHKPGRLKKLFNSAAICLASALSLGTGPSLAAPDITGNETVNISNNNMGHYCPSFPEFNPSYTRVSKEIIKIEPDEHVRNKQKRLGILGFNLQADGIEGLRTKQGYKEFSMFYKPLLDFPDWQVVPTQKYDVQANSLIHNTDPLLDAFSELALRDQKRFKVDSEVLSAIRLAHLYTDIDFGFMMELADAESGFKPDIKSKRSSATGMYQFIDDTWLKTIKSYGHKYGLGIYADQVEFYTDDNGKERAIINNPIIHQHVLELRTNPRISALLAAEFTLENDNKLSCYLNRKINRTERYLAHFFGPEDVVHFIRAFNNNPNQIAADLFPDSAKANPGVFKPWRKGSQTIKQIYDKFDQKFNTGKYEDWDYKPFLMAKLYPNDENHKDFRISSIDNLKIKKKN